MAATPALDLSLDDRKRFHDDFPFFARHCLTIRTKAAQLARFRLNTAQAYLHDQIEDQFRRTGKVRKIILKGRQQGCCLDPETRVLTADLRWVPIANLKFGDELVAVDEHSGSGRGNTRKMRTSRVEKLWSVRRPAYRMILDDGRQLVCSGNHRWLTRKSQVDPKWRSIDGDPLRRLKPGDLIRSVCDPWGDADLDDAWLAGMIDGEGSFEKDGTGRSLAITQRAGPVLDRLYEICERRGYAPYVVEDMRKAKANRVGAVTVSHMKHLFRLMGLCRPTRFIGRRWWEGKRPPDDCWNRIVSIEPVGDMDLIDIQTSTQTFIAEGVVSHNSTYVEGRFYWLVTHNFGMEAFILTHQQQATENLFNMADRYHNHCPVLLRPITGTANAKQLSFLGLESGYTVGTAGSKGVGRSATFQLFHGSEVAYWQAADTHAAGALQAVPNEPGTEVFLESTANGIGNWFHRQWVMAVKGESQFEPVFIPWYWQAEYRMAVPDDFRVRPDERELIELYNLDHEQLMWRRAKIVELEHLEIFMQEYPNTPDEAFQATTGNVVIPHNLVKAAINRPVEAIDVRPIWGVDVAYFGGDRCAVAKRKGNVLTEKVKTWSHVNTMVTAGRVFADWEATPEHDRPSHICVDVIGYGAGVANRLDELPMKGTTILGIAVSETEAVDEAYFQLRDQLWFKTLEWFQDRACRIPEDDEMVTELVTVLYDYTSAGRKKVESKKEMKKRLLYSPDIADAINLTFATEPVPMDRPNADKYARNRGRGRKRGWMKA